MLRIAIIDDDASVRNSIAMILQAHGHTTVSFETAVQFIDCADAKDFDCLLVDNNMPQMTGLELHEWLQGHNVHHPKFVLMSGRISDDSTLTLASRGIEFLSKPFDLAKLLQIVNS